MFNRGWLYVSCETEDGMRDVTRIPADGGRAITVLREPLAASTLVSSRGASARSADQPVAARSGAGADISEASTSSRKGF